METKSLSASENPCSMKEIPAKEIMKHWNAAHPENRLSLEDVNQYLQTHAFFNLSPSTLVSIMEKDFKV